MKKDIENEEDIKLLVNEFYHEVRQDSLLAPVFDAHISNWTPHLETMYKFWNATLLGIRGYVGNPFVKHMVLPLEANHFERWIGLFYNTLETHFEGPVADDARRRSAIIAHTFYSRIHGPAAEEAPLELPRI